MEFGLILPTVNNGNIISEAAPQWIPTWELNKQAIQKAERYGFEFALGQVTLRGFGGRTEMWDHALEPMTLVGGLAAVTERIKLYGSVPILAVNPAIAARMAVTLSGISGGRFGLNIVSGWSEAQYSQMDAWPGDSWYADRYKGAAEYVTILKELWETGVSDFKGEYFQMDDCRLGPLTDHKIEIVCAGQSDIGMAFTAQYGDYAFINGEGGADGLRRINDRLLAAAAKAGRDVRSHVTQIVIIRDTDEAAQERVAEIREGADLPALERITGQASLDASGSTSGRLSEAAEKLRDMVFFDLDVIAGSPATVADYLDELATVEGTAGVMLIFEDPHNGIDRFANDVAPLMATKNAVSAAA
jgi:pyrimidine oxygenase